MHDYGNTSDGQARHPFEDQPGPQRDVYSVSRLNHEVRTLLEGRFPLLWIEGEISNLARPASGHIYFTLKDAQAQVRCAMFRNRNQYNKARPENGSQVLLRARISLYENRGDYQLIVEHMEEAGDGALRRAFEELKQRLAKEGLFDEALKKAPPELPKRIGVITSPSGAAIRDVLTVLARRFPGIPVLIYPVPVQGDGAATQIAAAIDLADKRRDCDVLLLTRGGGSLEDLWAFNEEPVARAIHRCGLPLVSAIGHEIDFTIADFAADRRAATPSAAAEMLSPDRTRRLLDLVATETRLSELMRRHLRHLAERLAWTSKRLQHPGQRLRAIAQRLDELEMRMTGVLRARLRHGWSRLGETHAHLRRLSPAAHLPRLTLHHEQLQGRLRQAMRALLARRRQALAALMRELDAVSPLATLGRGYAIVRRLPEGEVLRDTHGIEPSMRVETQLAKGRLVCRVEEIKT